MSNKYSDFLKKLKLPLEEEFNELIEQLPPYEELSDNLEFNPEWDNLDETIFNYGVLGDKYFDCWANVISLEEKTVVINDINSPEDLEEINNMLKAAGWTLENYEKDVEYWKEQASQEKIDAEKQNLLDELKELTLNQLKEIIENVNKG